MYQYVTPIADILELDVCLSADDVRRLYQYALTIRAEAAHQERERILSELYNRGHLRYADIQPLEKPRHGTCCTCQDCGRAYDECVCGDNEIIKIIKDAQEEE